MVRFDGIDIPGSPVLDETIEPSIGAVIPMAEPLSPSELNPERPYAPRPREGVVVCFTLAGSSEDDKEPREAIEEDSCC